MKYFLSIAVVSSCLVFSHSPHGFAGEEPEPPGEIQISLHPTIPVSRAQPELLIRYHNAGKTPLSLTLPFVGPAPADLKKLVGRNDLELDQTLRFRQLDLTVDGRIAKVRHTDSMLGDVAWTRSANIQPGKHVDLKLQLNDIYKIPKDWQTIDIKTSMIFGIEAKFVGNLTIRRVRHTFLDPIHVTAAPVLPMDFDDPKITVRFQNIGKKVFHLPLPKAGTETKMFWSVDAKIDRKKVRSFGDRSPDGGYKPWTRFVPLEAGESTEITIRLKDYFKIPKDWKLIEIGADEFSLPKKGRDSKFMNPEYQDTLTLTRPLKRPINVPPVVWDRSDDRVRWFLYHQQEQLEKLKAKPAQKR